MSGRRGFGLAALVVSLTALLMAGAAAADPANAPWSRTIQVDCTSRSTTLVAVGNGWHSAPDVKGTDVFVPLSSTESGTFYDPAGGAHPFQRPPDSKGSASPNGHPIVSCTFSVNELFPDNSRLVVTGALTGFFTS
ncbi:MAG TPA: hypothetical protein VFK76_09880 [Gaiellaceae bacterium]|nr:hypothetical protein [Gaiellaceae bacterium]